MRLPIALIVALSLIACERESVEETAPAPAPVSAAPVAASTAAAPSMQVPAVTLDGDNIDIAFAGQTLRGEIRDSGKRKYSVAGGPVAWEVKPGDDGGFKLRTADGRLRWKVKVTPEKIKISDNEENKNPYELKVREGGRVKVFGPGEKELGNVRFANSKIEVENAAGQKQFEIPATSASGAYGVLLFDAIPPQERAILIAEILSRGR
ncbi:MAG TPA: hypothetical protein VNI54_02295 [Thermoanaerobaculia bacterium]|nr:hypothetical protein [Thermoanaerobaculia bacterium]